MGDNVTSLVMQRGIRSTAITLFRAAAPRYEAGFTASIRTFGPLMNRRVLSLSSLTEVLIEYDHGNGSTILDMAEQMKEAGAAILGTEVPMKLTVRSALLGAAH